MQKKIKKAVILLEEHDSDLNILARTRPVCVFPVFNRPLIEYTLETLRRNGIDEIIVAGHEDRMLSCVLEHLRRRGCGLGGLRFERTGPSGQAGMLRDLRGILGEESFLVLSSNIFLGDLFIDGLVRFHYEKGSTLTVCATRTRPAGTEGIRTTEEGAVEDFRLFHASRDKRSYLRPLEIFLFDRRALEFVGNKGYFDIKEQLVPALKAASKEVFCYELNGHVKAINSVEDYYEVHRKGFLGGFRPAHLEAPGGGPGSGAHSVWVAPDASVAEDASIIGPAVIFGRCRIGKKATIIGPTVLGDGCVVDDNAVVRECVVWEDTTVGEKGAVEYCVLGPGVRIAPGESYRDMVIVEGIAREDANLLPLSHGLSGVAQVSGARLAPRGFKLIKRLMDVVLSLFGILALWPLMLMMAIVIKLDSAGPVLFRQKRCGKDGREFMMLKFRTMVNGASKMQRLLASQNGLDGPVFKIANDPRITRAGRFLRKTSLDELPQLFNVLKGEMSMVGPRPLVIDEMRFAPWWRDIRLNVKPGITGLWQISGRSDVSFNEWIKNDISYVKNQSLPLDLKILLKTVGMVLQCIGAR